MPRRVQEERSPLDALLEIAHAPAVVEAIKAVGNTMTSVAQASATSPLAAGTTAVILGGLARPVIGKGGQGIINGMALGYVGAEAVGGILEGVGSIAGRGSQAETVNITYDIPDVPAFPGRPVAAQARQLPLTIPRRDVRRVGIALPAIAEEAEFRDIPEPAPVFAPEPVRLPTAEDSPGPVFVEPEPAPDFAPEPVRVPFLTPAPDPLAAPQPTPTVVVDEEGTPVSVILPAAATTIGAAGAAAAAGRRGIGRGGAGGGQVFAPGQRGRGGLRPSV